MLSGFAWHEPREPGSGSRASESPEHPVQCLDPWIETWALRLSWPKTAGRSWAAPPAPGPHRSLRLTRASRFTAPASRKHQALPRNQGRNLRSCSPRKAHRAAIGPPHNPLCPTDPPLPPPPELRCELRSELGRGATGRVWLAELLTPLGDLPAGAGFALKRMHAELQGDARQRASFDLERSIVMELDHPGIVTGLAQGEDAHGPWLAMQHLPGANLAEQLEELGALPEPRVRAALERLASALSSLHQAGYLHGDLKPENVRLDGQGRAVLLDFGFAQRVDQPSREARTTGSLPYLSPEEMRGGRACEASEVYSLGVLLYELATGRHPFATREQLESPTGLASRIQSAEFTSPSLHVPTLSPFLDRLLEMCLDRDPGARPSLGALQQIGAQQEESSWWRDQLDAPRGQVRPTIRSSSALPLVGRDLELDALRQAATIAMAIDGQEFEDRGGAVELRGSSGSGKSRLMREFAALARMRKDPPLCLLGRCPRFEEQRPCGPVIELLQRFLQLPAGASPGERERQRLDELLPSSERDTLLEALEPAFDGATTTSVPAALHLWLTQLAEERPLVVFLDDLDHGDEGTLEIMTRLLRTIAGQSMLVVLGRDSEELPRRPEAMAILEEQLQQLRHFKRVELLPLDQEALRELTESLFDRTSPRLRLAKVLWERSRGNPGLISELLRGLIDRGEAIPGEFGLHLKIHPDELPLPESLRGEILEAYKRLDRYDRIWLGRLAVCGGRIQTRFLLRAWPRESESALDETLARLTRSGWLRSAGDRYRFRRPALRAAVYKRLGTRRRLALHASVAHALRPGPGGRQSLADAFQRAYHLRSAEHFTELMQILPPLLHRLEGRGQPARVYTLGLWGLDAIGRDSSLGGNGRVAVDFLSAAADAADRLGYREKQRVLLDQLSELDVDFEQDPELAGRIYLLHARYSLSVGQYGPGLGMMRNADRYFEQSGNRVARSEVQQRLAIARAHLGQMSEAREHGRRSLELATDEYSRARAELSLGVIELLEGKIESALQRSDRCLMGLRKTKVFEALAVRAMAHSLRARVYRGSGRPRRGLVSAQNALRFAQRAGERRLEIELQARLGGHWLDIDRVEQAEALLRDALLQAREIEDRRSESIAALLLGILLAEQGDPDGAPYLTQAMEVAHKTGLTRTEAVAISIHARVLFQKSPKRALERSSKAVELLDRAGAELIDRIVIRGTHAMILESLGQTRESREQVETLKRRMRSATHRIESPLLERRQRSATTQLLRAALSPEGPVYRRVRLDHI